MSATIHSVTDRQTSSMTPTAADQLKTFPVDVVVQRFGVGLAIERSLVRLPTAALSSRLGQLSFPSLRSR